LDQWIRLVLQKTSEEEIKILFFDILERTKLSSEMQEEDS
jgi:hypothetical protein